MSRLRTANLLAALAGDVTDLLDARLKAHPNQTTSSAAALNVLGFWDGCSNAELSRVLGLSHTATVRLVDKLEAEGLVVARTGIDRRAVALSLTREGETRARELLKGRCAAVAEVIDVLSDAEQAQLAGLLEKLLAPRATDDFRAAHICRLCDDTACPPEHCPMHLGAR
jgi:MarR family transcriptional repressor of emrRAB